VIGNYVTLIKGALEAAQRYAAPPFIIANQMIIPMTTPQATASISLMTITFNSLLKRHSFSLFSPPTHHPTTTSL
jgi:hypothetical protein